MNEENNSLVQEDQLLLQNQDHDYENWNGGCARVFPVVLSHSYVVLKSTNMNWKSTMIVDHKTI